MPLYSVPIKETRVENGRVKETITRVEHVRASALDDARRATFNIIEATVKEFGRAVGRGIGELTVIFAGGDLIRYAVGQPSLISELRKGGKTTDNDGTIRQIQRNLIQRLKRFGLGKIGFTDSEYSGLLAGVVILGAYAAGKKLFDILVTDKPTSKSYKAQSWGHSSNEAIKEAKISYPLAAIKLLGIAGKGVQVADKFLSEHNTDTMYRKTLK